MINEQIRDKEVRLISADGEQLGIMSARDAYKLAQEGQSGCKTVFDIAPAYLSAKSGAELRKHLL